MKKILLFLLLFIPSIVFAQEDSICKNIGTKEHDEMLQQFYDLLIVGGYRAREQDDTSDKMIMEFFNSLMKIVDGNRYDNTKLNEIDPEKLNRIKQLLPYDFYKSRFQYCCGGQNTTEKSKCLNEIFMEMIDRVAIKSIENDFDINSVNVKKTFSDEEEFVKQYVKNRFEIDTDVTEIEQRWGPNGAVSKMSSDSVYTNFWEWYAKGRINEAKEKGLSRKIEILDIKRIPRVNEQEHNWSITISSIDTSSLDGTYQKRNWEIDIILSKTDIETFKVIRYGERIVR